MKRRILLSVMVLAVAFNAAPSGAVGEPPVAVSPGSAREVMLIDQRCPTFSWGAIEGPTTYELVVYRLPQGIESGLEGVEPLLRESLPVGASSWTPSMGRCLSPGGRYAWLVRSDGAEGASDWSEPQLFQVAAGPSAVEVEQALAVLQAYLAAGGVELGSEPGQLSRSTQTGLGDRSQATESAPRGGEEPEGVPSPDVTAVRGQVSDTTGVTFGLHGISASTTDGSSGVVGESTAASGATYGVLAQVQSAAGVAGAFDNTAGGAILSGRNNAVEVFSVDGAGNVAVSGQVDGVDVSGHAGNTDAHHTPPTTLPPSGAAGGDLSGVFPDPDVVDDSHSHADATIANTLSIDNGRLFAPSGAGNVGIGTIAPEAKLHVQGSAKFVDGTQGSGKVLTSDASGLASWQAPTVGVGLGDSPTWTGSHTWTQPINLPSPTTADYAINIEGIPFIKEIAGGFYLNQVGTIAAGNRVLQLITGANLHVRSDNGDVKLQTSGSSTKLIVKNGGNIGIGTDSPVDKLHVVGDIRVGTGTEGCVKDADGTVIAGTCSSDIRLKRNVTPLSGMLQRVTRLTPVYFNWRSEEFPQLALGDETQLGLIAQEVEGILPELVSEGEDGLKRVRYSELPLLLLQGLKEQQQENERLNERLNELSKRLSALASL